MVELGKLDELHPVLGVRGTGKSTWLLELAARFHSHYQAIVIAHSPLGLLPIHETKIEVVSVPTVETLRKAMKKRRKLPPIYMVTRDSPEDVRDYVVDLATNIKHKALKKAGHKLRKNIDTPVPPGVMATPVILMVDEGSSARTRKGSGKITEEWNEFLARMRHWHVGLVYGNQRPSQMAYAFAELSTHIHAFRYEHRWGLDALRAAGMPEEMVRQVPKLEKFQRLSYSRFGDPAFL